MPGHPEMDSIPFPQMLAITDLAFTRRMNLGHHVLVPKLDHKILAVLVFVIRTLLETQLPCHLKSGCIKALRKIQHCRLAAF